MKNVKTSLAFLLLFTVLMFPVISKANSVRTVMQDCAFVVDARFDFEKVVQDTKASNGYLLCLGIMMGTKELFFSNCLESYHSNFWRGQDPQVTGVFRLNYAAAAITNDATIQAFMNWAEKNPAKWDDFYAMSVKDWLPKAFPCNEDALR